MARCWISKEKISEHFGNLKRNWQQFPGAFCFFNNLHKKTGFENNEIRFFEDFDTSLSK